MYTEDGTIILETDDLIDWAIQNYRSLMADHLERLYQGKQEAESRCYCKILLATKADHKIRSAKI